MEDKSILLNLICENANISIEIESIKDDTKLIEELEYDSIALIQLLVDIEDEFNVDLTNDDLLANKLNTPASLMELIERCRVSEDENVG